MRALRVLAGPTAREHLRQRGLRPEDVRAVPGAAGGPKGLALNPLDRYLFGDWLRGADQPVHLIGASIGAWRMAAACMPDADRALARLAEDYIGADYFRGGDRRPGAQVISDDFRDTVKLHFAGREPAVLSHPAFRLHVVASRGRHVLHREGRWRTPAGFVGAYATNLLARRALGAWLERVVFSDPRDELPFPLTDYRSHRVALTPVNFHEAVVASCSIPFWMKSVPDVPGAPPGAYWDGGLTDYHLHWRYDALADGLALYPHFQASVVPGWLDKSLRHRHRSTAALDRLVVLAPRAEWVSTLPGGRLPDRSDFQRYGRDVAGRQAAWRRALAESQRLADEFATLVVSGRPIDAEAL
ncbi:patatin-like phospholipase family protein [Ideonella sp.]|uniref:patatin-like phospholipase family protein n=1 Tax=Ideonella sp. TaxID=1929293 RepID=UPI002B462D01|nr:patatin-like phospholipase family protein [Ideonella sp.]HJV72157.1 patatin-like phospholipase family protein [Ideonella sp.]